MSLKGNNVHWIAPNILAHQAFNTTYDRVYFTPQGKVLKCFSWLRDGKVMEPDENVTAAIESALRAPILGLRFNILKEEVNSYSPYVILNGITKSNLTLLMKAHFSEHTTDSYGWNEKIIKMFPHTPDDLEFIQSIINLEIAAIETEDKKP